VLEAEVNAKDQALEELSQLQDQGRKYHISEKNYVKGVED